MMNLRGGEIMAARSNSIDQWIDTVGNYYKKLPELPKNGRDIVVSIVPWLAIIFGILGLIGSLVGLGVLTFLVPVALLAGVRETGQGILVVLLGLVSSVLMVLAFPGTKARKEKGWKLLYYSEVVSLITNVVTLSLIGVLFTLVGFYFLYQIRNYYK